MLDYIVCRIKDVYAFLQISDPISMTAVVGLVTSILLIILVAFMITGYAYKRRKLCFKDTIPVAVSTKKRSKTRSTQKVNIF